MNGVQKDLGEVVSSLVRSGRESSRATKRLREAAKALARQIEDVVPVGAEMPRGYYVTRVRSNVGSAKFLCLESEDGTEWIDGLDAYLHGDFHAWVPAPSREALLQFAEDVADGWLEEVAAWLEERAQKANKLAEVLEKASFPA